MSKTIVDNEKITWLYNEGLMEGKLYSKNKISFPKRYVLAIMIFFGFAILYSLRVNLNIAINAMCNNHTLYSNGSLIFMPPEFNWTSQLQGTILGSFYYGYLVMQIPGGWMAFKVGGTRIFGLAIGVASVLTLMSPLAARTHPFFLIALRIIEGLFLGVLFPCNHAIWGFWAPSNERSRLFSITAAGCPFGTIITMPISGILSKYGLDGGWPSIFYLFGFVGLFWFILWCLIVHDIPQNHPTITHEELCLIESTCGNKEKLNKDVPWKEIITSHAIWACVIANFCADWGLYTILICIPKYLIEVQHFDIAKAGFVASVPYVIKTIVGPLGGFIADKMISHQISVKNVRRSIFAFGCSVAGCFIVGVGYAPTPTIAIILLSIGVGITGLNATGYAVNILDIAPKYAGIVMGFSNVFGSMPGFISPQVVGFITQNKKADEWRVIFWITFGVYIFGILFFATFLEDKIQHWAIDDDEESKKTLK